MKFWNPFKRFVDEPPVIRDHLALVEEFTTDDEPKLVDYPRGKYKVYWEILIGEVPGGTAAQVRFYAYACGTLLEQKNFIEPSLEDLKPQVNALIRATMAKYLRVRGE
jgi:hypothetical protein